MVGDESRNTPSDDTEFLQFPATADVGDLVLDALEDVGVDGGSYTVLLRVVLTAESMSKGVFEAVLGEPVITAS